MAIDGTLTVGTLVALAALLGRLYGPLTALSNVRVDVMTALVRFERVFEVLDLEPMVKESRAPVDLPHRPLAVELRRRRLPLPLGRRGVARLARGGAPPGPRRRRPVLHDVTFSVRAGAAGRPGRAVRAPARRRSPAGRPALRRHVRARAGRRPRRARRDA